jgi:hypothetical protein
MNVHSFPPTGSREGIVSSECEHDTGRVNNLCCSSNILNKLLVKQIFNNSTRSLTCTTMMRLQMANMPLFPSTSRKSCPMGRGSVDNSRSDTDEVAKDAAIRRIHPRLAVAATPIRIAKGAERAAPADYETNLDKSST